MADESTAPWEADLEERFDDEETREAVSEYLRENIQPHITKLEQASTGDRQAQQLWDAFQENPIETYVEVTRELYGPEQASKIAEVIKSGVPPEEGSEDLSDELPSDDDEENPNQIKFDQLPDEVQEAVARQQMEEQRDAYYSEIDRLQDEHKEELPENSEGEPEINVDLFHPFVLAAEGDFDRAYEGYKNWMEGAKKQFGIKVPETEGGEPPPAIDTQTGSPAVTPPVKKEYSSLDDAMDDFFNEQKTAPPTV